MKALFPLSRTGLDWLLLACTIYLTSLSSHSAVTACVRDVHILCMCVCARLCVCYEQVQRQFHPRSYSVEQVMILLLTYVLITLFVMSVHFFLCLFVCVFWCRHSNDCSNRFIFMYCTTVCPYCVLSLCMCMWLFVCMHVCMSTAVCMSVCGCVWMCLFVCVSCVCARVGK